MRGYSFLIDNLELIRNPDISCVAAATVSIALKLMSAFSTTSAVKIETDCHLSEIFE